jgi:hypothetical protein
MVYLDTETQKEVTVTEAVRINYVKADKLASEPDPEVRKQLLILEVARLQKEAKDKADAGDYNAARSQLNEAVNFVTLNAQNIPDSVAYISSLQSMSGDFTDRHTYRSKGIKSATAFTASLSSNRASGSGVKTYSNCIMEDMERSFSMNDPVEDDEKKKKNS